MIDSLKTVAVGVGGMGATWLDALPIYVRVAVGLASFAYVCMKTYKLYKS